MKLRQRMATMLAVVLLCGSGAHATIHNISIGNFFFSPTNTVANVGDTIRWTWVSGSHSTTSDVSSAKVWDSGVKSSGTFDIVILASDGPGPFPYHCTPHAATMKDTIFLAAAAMNSPVNPMSLPGTDQNNASIAISRSLPGELYSVYNDFVAPFAIAPTVIGWSFSPAGGAPGTWMQAVKPPDVGLGYTEEWNPWISAIPIPAGGFIMVGSQRAGAPWAAVPNGIVMSLSPGGGAPFGPGFGVMGNVVGATWLDYPVVEVDRNLAGPSPGNCNMIWTEFIDANGGDLDGNGNKYDEAGDLWSLFAATTNVGGPGAPPYPGTTPPVVVAGPLPVYAGSMGSHRGAIEVVKAVGPLFGPGAVYVAYRDLVAGVVMVDANPAPGLGGLWGAIPPGGPVGVAPAPPIPPIIAPGFEAANHVTIATQPAGPCPGAVFVAWDDYVFGDADIFFASSFDGGITWTPAMRINQDPAGNGLDQWAPHMRVDVATGEIAVTYYDRRNDPANMLIEVWTSRSIDCGLTWTDCMVSRTGPMPPVSVTPMPVAPYVGDYLGTDHDPAFGWAYAWNDGRNGADQDIFFESLVLCDTDKDGIPDSLDNCPLAYNPPQLDSDGDGVGDLCDICPGFNDLVDSDLDGVPDGCDICPGFNDLVDSDLDGVPDGCDICPGFNDLADADLDGVPDGCDICPGFNDLLDADSDGVPDGCDICPGFNDLADFDIDGFPDSCDNCPSVFNPSQADSNSNGIGDACESTCCVGTKGNVDCDPADLANLTDLTTMVNNLFITFGAFCCPAEADINGDGLINLTDLTLLVNALFVTFTPLPPC